jgi:acetoacetate decarboxylase
MKGRCLALWFRIADGAALRHHVHNLLETDANPVIGARFWDLRVDAGRPDLVRERGALFRMREASIAIPVTFEGLRGDDTVYMWCDQPRYMAFAREVMGWPVIFGEVSFRDTPVGSAAANPEVSGDEWPTPHTGDKIDAAMSFDGRATMSMSFTLTGEIDPGPRPGVRWITHRFIPDVFGGVGVDQIVETHPTALALGPVWSAEAVFDLTGTPGSSLQELKPTSIERAELWSDMSLTIADGRVLRDLSLADR